MDDSILGKVAMVSVIIASTMYHRIAGIIVLIVIIAFMKSHFIKTTEGFEFPIGKTVSSPIIGTTSSSSSSSSDTWNTPDEFKQKFCTKVVVDGMDSLVYALNPNSKLVAYDSSGKMTDVGESYKRIDFASLNSCGITKNPINGKDQSGGILQLCNPTCNWKMSTKEGFTPMVANSSVQDAKNYVKDNANKLKDKLQESFSRFSY